MAAEPVTTHTQSGADSGRDAGDADKQWSHPADPQAVIRLLDEWMADESGYDEETWPKLKEMLDRDRLSGRSLFDG